ncbi:DUF3027 domain-containing protein [Micrococcus luteus]
MGEQTVPDQATAAQPEAAAPRKSARRRAPRRDEVLAEAVHTARAGLEGLAEEGQIGEHRGAAADDDRLMTHRWDAVLPGYRGWQWYSTVARAPRSKHVTVCEVGLTAGEDAIVAPAWVPYADRVSDEERARMKAVAEGRDPNPPAAGAPADAPAAGAPSGGSDQSQGPAEEKPAGEAEEAAVVVTEQAADPDPAPEAEEAAGGPAQES